MEQIVKTLVVEQEENGKGKTYNFMIEQRGEETLVLNTDTGVWKIDGSYNELAKLADRKESNIRIYTDHQLYHQLTDDKLLSYDPDETEYKEFSLLILETSEKCNLRCKYCFESAESSGDNMSCETAIKAFKKFIELDSCKKDICVEFNGASCIIQI